MRGKNKFLSNEDGAVAVIVALAMVVLLSMCALSIDIGRIYLEKAALQNAVDSAALAGAYKLPDTALASGEATEYIVKNGYSAENIQVQFEYSNTVIHVIGTKRTDMTFAKIFNVNYVDATVSAKAKKEIKPLEQALGFRIFQGSQTNTLDLGGTVEIFGSVHSNGGLNVSPAYGYIEGSAESCTDFYINPYTTTVGTKILNAGYIEMPDFTSETSQVFPSSYDTVLNGTDFSKKSGMTYITGNTEIIGDCTMSNQAVISGNLYVDGNLTIGGSAPACQLNGNIYATGSITFTNTFAGCGCVFAKGNITFQGGGAQFSTGQPICLYSEAGNISFTTSTSEVHGIVYAPKGTVNVQGGTLTFYGSIVGNEITGIPSDLKMYDLDVEMPFQAVKTVTRLIE